MLSVEESSFFAGGPYTPMKVYVLYTNENIFWLPLSSIKFIFQVLWIVIITLYWIQNEYSNQKDQFTTKMCPKRLIVIAVFNK